MRPGYGGRHHRRARCQPPGVQGPRHAGRRASPVRERVRGRAGRAVRAGHPDRRRGRPGGHDPPGGGRGLTASRTAFVTGGTGLVGGFLVDALLAGGVEVVALARAPQGARRLADAGAQVVRGDIGEADRWSSRVADCDAIFHVGLPRLVP
ncbi:MAG: NAD-dependent epimerase/dehydratase family protein, partial [Actinobacteria bacterium]|nr:NAD-dependent epimerase/dehydratase family protein [Actinomycetota bacterium]